MRGSECKRLVATVVRTASYIVLAQHEESESAGFSGAPILGGPVGDVSGVIHYWGRPTRCMRSAKRGSERKGSNAGSTLR